MCMSWLKTFKTRRRIIKGSHGLTGQGLLDYLNNEIKDPKPLVMYNFAFLSNVKEGYMVAADLKSGQVGFFH